MHIAIAGNIGSGKTSLATLLGSHLSFNVEYEDASTNPYIVDFYKDMNQWSFHLQVHFLQSRLKQFVSIQNSNDNIIQDRTIYEDAEIFAPNLLSMGLLTQREYETYKNLFESIIGLLRPPDLLIYLKASISTLVDHIAERGREYEDSIRIDYLKKLNKRYDDWFRHYSKGKKIEIDIDQLNFQQNPEDLGVVLSKLRAEMYGLFTTE